MRGDRGLPRTHLISRREPSREKHMTSRRKHLILARSLIRSDKTGVDVGMDGAQLKTKGLVELA